MTWPPDLVTTLSLAVQLVAIVALVLLNVKITRNRRALLRDAQEFRAFVEHEREKGFALWAWLLKGRSAVLRGEDPPPLPEIISEYAPRLRSPNERLH